MKTSPFPLTEELRLSLLITIKVEGGARKNCDSNYTVFLLSKKQNM